MSDFIQEGKFASPDSIRWSSDEGFFVGSKNCTADNDADDDDAADNDDANDAVRSEKDPMAGDDASSSASLSSAYSARSR
jgi:hypothetical protein